MSKSPSIAVVKKTRRPPGRVSFFHVHKRQASSVTWEEEGATSDDDIIEKTLPYKTTGRREETTMKTRTTYMRVTHAVTCSPAAKHVAGFSSAILHLRKASFTSEQSRLISRADVMSVVESNIMGREEDG